MLLVILRQDTCWSEMKLGNCLRERAVGLVLKAVAGWWMGLGVRSVCSEICCWVVMETQDPWIWRGRLDFERVKFAGLKKGFGKYWTISVYCFEGQLLNIVRTVFTACNRNSCGTCHNCLTLNRFKKCFKKYSQRVEICCFWNVGKKHVW